jgi:hypothetical protein
MILTTLQVDPADLERRTGWHVTPEGLCKGQLCMPFPMAQDGPIDVRALAEQLEMPILHDPVHQLWCLGPASGGRALTSAAAPELVLPELDGTPFALDTLRGQKVLLVAWASW